MLKSLNSYELTEWYVYEQIEPFGERGAYFRNAMLCAIMANPHRKKGTKSLKVQDFMPKFDDDGQEKPGATAQLQHSMEMAAEYFKIQESKKG